MEEKNINEEQLEKVNKKGMFLIVLLLLILVLLVIGVTYQVYLYSGIGESSDGKNGTIHLFDRIIGHDSEVGVVTTVYTEGRNRILIDNMMPMSDAKGKVMVGTSAMMDFAVHFNIHKKSRITTQISALKDDSSTIPDKYVKMYVQRSINGEQFEEEILSPTAYTGIEEDNEFGTKKGSMILDEVTTSRSITYNYRLRMWLDTNYPVDSTKRYFTVRVNTNTKGERIKK